MLIKVILPDGIVFINLSCHELANGCLCLSFGFLNILAEGLHTWICALQ